MLFLSRKDFNNPNRLFNMLKKKAFLKKSDLCILLWLFFVYSYSFFLGNLWLKVNCTNSWGGAKKTGNWNWNILFSARDVCLLHDTYLKDLETAWWRWANPSFMHCRPFCSQPNSLFIQLMTSVFIAFQKKYNFMGKVWGWNLANCKLFRS